jgi:hypothetical protein
VHRHHQRRGAEPRDRREVAQRIVGQLPEGGGIHRQLGGVGHQQHVAVGLRLHHRLGGDDRRRTRPVLDHDRLPPALAERLRHQPRHQVGAAAGRVADQDAHRALGILRRRRGGEEQGGKQRGKAKASGHRMIVAQF